MQLEEVYLFLAESGILLRTFFNAIVPIVLITVLLSFCALVFSLFLVFYMKRKGLLKRSGNWKYLSFSYYLVIPVLLTFSTGYLSLLSTGARALGKEIHKAREKVEPKITPVFISNFDSLVDPNYLRTGQLDSLIVGFLSEELDLKEGSVSVDALTFVSGIITAILLKATVEESSDLIKIDESLIENAIDQYAERDTEAFCSSLFDITEGLINLPIKQYVRGNYLLTLIAVAAILLMMGIETRFNAPVFKEGRAQE